MMRCAGIFCFHARIATSKEWNCNWWSRTIHLFRLQFPLLTSCTRMPGPQQRAAGRAALGAAFRKLHFLKRCMFQRKFIPVRWTEIHSCPMTIFFFSSHNHMKYCYLKFKVNPLLNLKLKPIKVLIRCSVGTYYCSSRAYEHWKGERKERIPRRELHARTHTSGQTCIQGLGCVAERTARFHHVRGAGQR